MHISEVEDKELIIPKNSLTRNLIFVANGKLIICKDDGPNEVVGKGAIIGIEQFLFN
jgi:hypothetical protein